MWEPVVVTHGVGYVVRSIATYITMQQLAKSFLRRRIIMAIAVRKRQDSSKKTTVLEGIILIVLSVGELGQS